MAYLPLKLDGEVYSDKTTLALYSTDASMYQLIPDMVTVPKNEEDVSRILAYASAQGLSILPRGSATSLAGQTVNNGIVIDFTKYFNSVVKIDVEQKRALVQPGVMRDQLNELVAQHGLHFAPDPATSNRASIGGMIANNSSGTKSILYGKTSENLASLKVMLADGTILKLKTTSVEDYDKICLQGDREGEIYRNFRKIIFENTESIIAKFPKVMRRVTGYALDAFVNTETWNLAHLICGSEGSLAVILEAELILTPLPMAQNMVVIHFSDRIKGIQSVKEIVSYGPAAVEVLDYNVLTQSKLNAITNKYHKSIITGDPELVLTVEFYGATIEEIEIKTEQLLKYLSGYENAYAYPVFYEKVKINDGLNLRKDGLGLLMGKIEPRKPQAFVEDSAIPLEHLADYVEEVYDICAKHQVEMVIYAHASVGVLHIRPFLDLTLQRDIDLMKKISDEVFQLVLKYGGAWSGEHGDGRNRGPRMKDYFGDQVYEALKEVKQLFDPNNLLNPNIIIGTPPMDQHLRYGAEYKEDNYKFQYKYRKDQSFQDIVHMCSGVGACRKNSGGTMCPSFRATQEEKDSTRGRANALRLAMSRQLDFKDLTDEKVIDVLDLCLSCKACKTECPSNVDMSKLKSEVLQLKYSTKGSNLDERLPKYAPMISKAFSGFWSPFINFVQRSTIFRIFNEKLTKIDRRRALPAYANKTLVSYFKNRPRQTHQKTVALFADTYVNYHQPQIGIKAIELLESFGYQVELVNAGCCQRPLISNGFLIDAKRNGKATLDALLEYANRDIPILAIEPSCFTSLQTDLLDLMDDDQYACKLEKAILPIEDFIAEAIKMYDGPKQITSNVNEIVIHGHCHQKASYGTQSMKYILSQAKVQFKELETGCCGMAGAFGYEQKHFDISKQIAQQALLPQLLENPNATVVAHGFSCKHQIQDFASRQVKHIVEIIELKD